MALVSNIWAQAKELKKDKQVKAARGAKPYKPDYRTYVKDWHATQSGKAYLGYVTDAMLTGKKKCPVKFQAGQDTRTAPLPSKIRNVYIYSLCDPDTGTVKYVGKSNYFEIRYEQHLKERGFSDKCKWVDGLKKQGKVPRLKILETCSKDDWKARERFWIKHYKQFGHLTNIAPGGEQSRPDDVLRNP